MSAEPSTTAPAAAAATTVSTPAVVYEPGLISTSPSRRPIVLPGGSYYRTLDGTYRSVEPGRPVGLGYDFYAPVQYPVQYIRPTVSVTRSLSPSKVVRAGEIIPAERPATIVERPVSVERPIVYDRPVGYESWFPGYTYSRPGYVYREPTVRAYDDYGYLREELRKRDEEIAFLRAELARLKGTPVTVQDELQPMLGVEIKMLDDAKGGRNNVVVVHSIMTGGPADVGGVQPNDVLAAWNGIPIDSKAKFQQLLSSSRIGTQVTLDVVRGGMLRPVVVTVGSTTRSTGRRSRIVPSKTKI